MESSYLYMKWDSESAAGWSDPLTKPSPTNPRPTIGDPDVIRRHNLQPAFCGHQSIIGDPYVINVQRRMTKLIPQIWDLQYPESLRILKLPSIAYRRSRGDMIEVYKLLTGKYSTNEGLIKITRNSSTRGHYGYVEERSSRQCGYVEVLRSSTVPSTLPWRRRE